MWIQLIRKIRSFADLSFSGKICFLQTGGRLFFLGRSLRRKTFKAVLESIRDQAVELPAAKMRPPGLTDLCRWVNIWAAVLPGTYNCLPRALTAYVLCRQRGYPVELRLGVALDGETSFEAHAWVESEGRIVLGNLPELEKFHIFNDFNTFLS